MDIIFSGGELMFTLAHANLSKGERKTIVNNVPPFYSHVPLVSLFHVSSIVGEAGLPSFKNAINNVLIFSLTPPIAPNP